MLSLLHLIIASFGTSKQSLTIPWKLFTLLGANGEMENFEIIKGCTLRVRRFLLLFCSLLYYDSICIGLVETQKGLLKEMSIVVHRGGCKW